MRVFVGSQTRKAGRTALIAALLRKFPELDWTAVKVTPHRHRNGALEPEQDAESGADTSRYLQAGARRAFLLTTGADWESDARRLLEIAGACQNLLVESNGAANLVREREPHLRVVCLMIVSPGVSDVKPSAVLALPGVDAFLFPPGVADVERPWWIPEEFWRGKPRFCSGEGLTPAGDLIEYLCRVFARAASG